MPAESDSTASDESADEPPDVNRRPLLKALGVGAALAFGSRRVRAEHSPSHPAEIDPNYGYATPDAGTISSLPGDLQPNYTVELHVRQGVPYEPGPPKETEHGPLFHFDPAGLALDVGDVVEFRYTTPDHTITAYHNAHGFQHRVPPNVPPFSSPVVNAGGAWLYEFTEPGLYDVYCGPHHILGMVMRLVVGDPENWAGGVPDYEDTFEGSAGPPPILAPFGKEFLEDELNTFSEPHENKNPEWVWLTPQEVLDADALDPENVWANESVSIDGVLADIDRIQTT
ncbi:plastocyanin/azurin family copper-binding protein [Haloplanus sp. GCM10025708]|uniref:cupredoxin domain-containing protein n=1 Tax=Haloferacaceae TaxID=1644056 RepID=UPI003616BA17